MQAGGDDNTLETRASSGGVLKRSFLGKCVLKFGIWDFGIGIWFSSTRSLRRGRKEFSGMHILLFD